MVASPIPYRRLDTPPILLLPHGDRVRLNCEVQPSPRAATSSALTVPFVLPSCQDFFRRGQIPSSDPIRRIIIGR